MRNNFVSEDAQATSLSEICLEAAFHDMAGELRDQLEQKLLPSHGIDVGMTPLKYAFFEKRYQFLTTSSEHIFTQVALTGLIEHIRAWAADTVGTSYVSTPQLRVYIKDCWRDIFKDEVATRWHYSLCLDRREAGTTGLIKILSETKDAKETATTARIQNHHLAFNQLIVHCTSRPYGILPSTTSMNPLDGLILLDGYLW